MTRTLCLNFFRTSSTRLRAGRSAGFFSSLDRNARVNLFRVVVFTLCLPLFIAQASAQVRMRLPFDNGQWWGPATYDGHLSGYGSGKEVCIDWWCCSYQGDDQPNNWQFWTQGVSQGRTVRAAFKGTIWLKKTGTTGYGNEIIIQSDEDSNWGTLYGHLNDIDPKVVQGQTVEEGQVIGHVGSTGNTGGAAHLHFELLRKSGSSWSSQPLEGRILSGQAIDFRGYTTGWTIGSGSGAFYRYEGHSMQGRDNITATPPLVSWTHHVNPNAKVWYRDLAELAGDHPNSFTFSISGSDPLNVWEYVDGNHPADQPHHNHGGWIELDRGGVGMHTYRVYAENAAGNHSIQFDMGFDNVAPTANWSGGATSRTWLRGSQTVIYTGYDAHSGFKDSQWWIEGGQSGGWTPENPRTVPLPTADGKYKLFTEVADNSYTGAAHFGNSSGTLQIGEFWIDNTKPTVEFADVTPPSPADALSVTIKVAAGDPGGDNASGIKTTTVTVDGNNVSGANGVFSWDVSAVPEGDHTIVATATDNAGNSSSATRHYIIDRAPPTATLSVSPTAPNGKNGYYTTQPVVTIVSQALTGSAIGYYRINGGGDQIYKGPFSLPGSGSVRVDYWAVSSFGRTSPVSTATYLVDLTAPIGFTLQDEGVTTPSTRSLSVSLIGNVDPESPLWKLSYRVGKSAGDETYRAKTDVVAAGPWLTITGLSLPPGQKVFVSVRATNRAGLASKWYYTDGITVDPSAWIHAIWNFVFGGAGNVVTDGFYVLGGTFGEAVVGQSFTDNRDASLDAGIWPVMIAPRVAGKVTLQDYVATAVEGATVKVDLRLPGTMTVVESQMVTLDNMGRFFLIPSHIGTFDVVVRGSHWLASVQRNVVISPTGVLLAPIVLVNGDINGDNQIGDADQAALTAAFRSRRGDPKWNPNADLNGDGVVSASDQAILGKNFGKKGDG